VSGLDRGITATAVVLAALCWTARAGADETSEIEGLLDQPVITTASKSVQTGAAAPALSSTLTSEDMARLGIRSLDQAIDFLSTGVMTSNPLNTVEIGARGVLLPNDHGNHFLLLVNGHAVNEPLFGSAKFDRGAGIPIELIDHIEVIVGPGSVLYGSNAMLGVINVITKRAAHFRGVHLAAESEIMRSYRAAAGAGYEFKLAGEAAEAVIEVEYIRQDGPTLDFGPQDYGTNYTGELWRFTRDGSATGIWGGASERAYYSEIPAGLLTLKWGTWEVNAAASIYKRAMPYSAPYEEQEKDFDDPESFERDRSVWLDVKKGVAVSSVVELGVRAYGDLHDYERIANTSSLDSCFYLGVRTCRYSFAGLSRAAGLEIQASFDWFETAELVTLLGADGRVRSVASKSDLQDYDTEAYLVSSHGVIDGSDVTGGAYLQQTWQPVRWLALNAGGRVDIDPRFDPVPSPRVAASVNPWDDATLKAIYSEAFRAPSFYETDYRADTQLPAEDLKPETVRSIEAIFEQRLGAHRVFVGAFRTWWHDLVELRVLSPEEFEAAKLSGELSLRATRGVQFRNISSVDQTGFNAGLGGVFGGAFHYGGSVTGALARLETEAGTDTLPVAPRLFGNAHVAYELGGKLPTLGLAARYLAKRPADRTIGGGFAETPYAPAVAEIRATVGGAAPLISGLSYQVSADYLTADRGAYLVGPLLQSTAEVRIAELNPVDTFKVAVGLAYVFGN
jgi:outer membrane receptor for ferrienterochelin and colicins